MRIASSTNIFILNIPYTMDNVQLNGSVMVLLGFHVRYDAYEVKKLQLIPDISQVTFTFAC
jgi:hypothetical protein